jgi:ABC-type nitrate/sulfonate/bicarbonate transport system substrate-binding protein
MLAAAVGLVVGLGTLLPLASEAAPTEQKGLRTVRFITFTQDAATVAARTRGYFAAEGLDVEVIITPNSTVQMRGLSDGTYDIASTAFDNVLAWSGREGAEIAAIFQREAGTMLPLYVGAEINDWSDLRGKPLAADAVDTAFALVLRRILLAHDLDMDRGDYELVALGATQARLDSMARGETFAGILSTQLEAAAQAAGLKRMADHLEVLPDYPGGVYAVNRAWAQQNRGDLVRFVRAWLAAGRWVENNREAAIELMMTHQNMSRPVAATTVDGLTPSGAMNVAGLESVLGLRNRFGLTPPMGPNIARYYDASFLQQAGGR